MDKLIIICGPTGSGKTKLAISLAKLLDTEIISADSMAVYQDMDIGTAKPTIDEQKEVKHHLINVVSPFDEFSVSDYREKALSVIAELHSKNKIPIICGGTGFYINSVLYNLTYGGAAADQEFRDEYNEKVKNLGYMAVYNELLSIDPESAKNISPNDSKRVIRALEIYYKTGKIKSLQNDKMVPNYDYRAFMINYPREELYERINKRVDLMFEAGLEAEVKGLIEKGLTRDYQSTDGIGYKEIYDALSGNCAEDVKEIIKINSRHYAKRQITFFKKLENLVYLSPEKAFDEMIFELKKDNFI